jgi:outer membrane protein OmpA-like peptidoglycan-associated protein
MGYITILDKRSKIESGPLKVQALKDRGLTTADRNHRTDDQAKRRVIAPIGFPLSEDYKLNIYFDFDSTRLSNDAFEKLEQLAAALLYRPEFRIIIKGFTDGSGTYSYNKLLSEYRANVVRSYLIGKRVESARIKTVGIGPAESSSANTPANLNRRVEIELHRVELTDTGGQR